MHLHGRLKDVILDYGPVQEFWCISFERYNGNLGKQPTNNRAIEPQLLQQFLLDNFSVHITSLMSLVKILSLWTSVTSRDQELVDQ